MFARLDLKRDLFGVRPERGAVASVFNAVKYFSAFVSAADARAYDIVSAVKKARI